MIAETVHDILQNIRVDDKTLEELTPLRADAERALSHLEQFVNKIRVLRASRMPAYEKPLFSYKRRKL